MKVVQTNNREKLGKPETWYQLLHTSVKEHTLLVGSPKYMQVPGKQMNERTTRST